MKAKAMKAFNELVAIGAPVMAEPWRGGHFRISGEMNLCAGEFGGNQVVEAIWADYWQECGIFADTFGVNPKIEDILSKHGLYCEWANAGVLDVYDA